MTSVVTILWFVSGGGELEFLPTHQLPPSKCNQHVVIPKLTILGAFNRKYARESVIISRHLGTQGGDGYVYRGQLLYLLGLNKF